MLSTTSKMPPLNGRVGLAALPGFRKSTRAESAFQTIDDGSYVSGECLLQRHQQQQEEPPSIEKPEEPQVSRGLSQRLVSMMSPKKSKKETPTPQGSPRESVPSSPSSPTAPNTPERSERKARVEFEDKSRRGKRSSRRDGSQPSEVAKKVLSALAAPSNPDIDFDPERDLSPTRSPKSQKAPVVLSEPAPSPRGNGRHNHHLDRENGDQHRGHKSCGEHKSPRHKHDHSKHDRTRSKSQEHHGKQERSERRSPRKQVAVNEPDRQEDGGKTERSERRSPRKHNELRHTEQGGSQRKQAESISGNEISERKKTTPRRTVRKKLVVKSKDEEALLARLETAMMKNHDSSGQMDRYLAKVRMPRSRDSSDNMSVRSRATTAGTLRGGRSTLTISVDVSEHGTTRSVMLDCKTPDSLNVSRREPRPLQPSPDLGTDLVPSTSKSLAKIDELPGGHKSRARGRTPEERRAARLSGTRSVMTSHVSRNRSASTPRTSRHSSSASVVSEAHVSRSTRGRTLSPHKAREPSHRSNSSIAGPPVQSPMTTEKTKIQSSAVSPVTGSADRMIRLLEGMSPKSDPKKRHVQAHAQTKLSPSPRKHIAPITEDPVLEDAGSEPDIVDEERLSQTKGRVEQLRREMSSSTSFREKASRSSNDLQAGEVSESSIPRSKVANSKRRSEDTSVAPSPAKESPRHHHRSRSSKSASPDGKRPAVDSNGGRSRRTPRSSRSPAVSKSTRNLENDLASVEDDDVFVMNPGVAKRRDSMQSAATTAMSVVAAQLMIPSMDSERNMNVQYDEVAAVAKF